MNTNLVKELNNLFTKYDNAYSLIQLCERCYKSGNLVLCEICRLFYHMECEYQGEYLSIPTLFLCNSCKNFKVSNSEARASFYDSRVFNPSDGQQNYEATDLNGSEVKRSKKHRLNDQQHKESTSSNKHENPQSAPNNQPSNNQSGTSEQEIPAKKMRKKRISNLDDFPFPETSDKTDKRKLQNFENTDINFKRRKIRVGDNYNMDMDHYFKNEDDIDETDICSGLRVVFTCRNKLTEREIDIYLREAKLLWDYRDISIEGELWFDFYEYFEEFIKYKELDVEQQQKVANKLNNLRSFVDRGINMENHFEEMALKILHICAYSTKKALFFIFKGINPFMEEEIEGFKSDVMQLQREVFCVFTDQDQDSNKYG